MNDTPISSQGPANSSPAADANAGGDQWVRPRVLLRRMRSSCASTPIWKFTLPAWAGVLPDGRTYNTCPSAGVCRDICFARAGTFRIPSVLRAHQRNLQYILDEPDAWQAQMIEELQHPRFRPGEARAHVRIHDSGDWFSESYLVRWLDIMRTAPDVVFYNYSKEVDLLERIARPNPPPNFLWRYSYGGTQDELIEPHHPHADVFPDEASLAAAGYTSQSESDLLAAYGPTTLGIAANNLPAQKRKQGGRTFRALQRAADAQAANRRHARRGPAPGRPKSR
ncbi:GP88 family protein [Streptomyces chattanoogensis]|uniref:GP88 family protein n=1 Tax=Streptomyces chattanoogensis TaxID=66876 RepID=UPI00367C7FD8